MTEEHEINELRNRSGEVIGASVFLSPSEIQELKQEGELTIRH